MTAPALTQQQKILFQKSPFNSRLEDFVFKQFLKVWIWIRILIRIEKMLDLDSDTSIIQKKAKLEKTKKKQMGPFLRLRHNKRKIWI